MFQAELAVRRCLLPGGIRRLAAVLFVLVLCAIAPMVTWAGYYDKVRQGEGLEGFARRNHVSGAQVQSANRLGAGSKLVAGAMLYVPRDRKPAATAGAALKPGTASGSLYDVRPGDTLSGVAKRNGVSTSELAKANGIPSNAGLSIGQRLRIPQVSPKSEPEPAPPPPAKKSESAAKAEPPPMRDVPGGGIARDSVPASKRGYIWPTEGRVIRRFVNSSSEKSYGIDIAAPLGSEVRAARDGKIVFAEDSIAAYGRMVIVQHDDDVATCYAHNRRILVRVGDRVKQGQVIAEVGNSGRSSTAALHFEIRRRGTAVNPEDYLP